MALSHCGTTNTQQSKRTVKSRAERKFLSIDDSLLIRKIAYIYQKGKTVNPKHFLLRTEYGNTFELRLFREYKIPQNIVWYKLYCNGKPVLLPGVFFDERHIKAVKNPLWFEKEDT